MDYLFVDSLYDSLHSLRFAAPITHVYNPLEYARAGWEQYVTKYARTGVEAVLVGMNPGPWGMAQTGVPFGEVNIVRECKRLGGRVSYCRSKLRALHGQASQQEIRVETTYWPLCLRTTNH